MFLFPKLSTHRIQLTRGHGHQASEVGGGGKRTDMKRALSMFKKGGVHGEGLTSLFRKAAEKARFAAAFQSGRAAACAEARACAEA